MSKGKITAILLAAGMLLGGCGGQQSQTGEVLLYEEPVSGSAVSGSSIRAAEEEFETTTVKKTTYKEEFSGTAEMEYTDTEVVYIDDEDAVLDSVKVKKFQRVKKGDVLAVYHVETSKTKLEKQKLLVDQARANYESGLSNLNSALSQAEQEWKMLTKKAEKNLKSLEIKKMKKEIETYKKGEKEVIEQEKEYAKLIRKQKKTKLLAKRSGIVTATGAAYVGEDIDSSSKIVELRNNDEWILRVEDPESKLRYNMDVSVRLGKSVRDYDHEIKGKVITASDITGVEETDEEGESIVYIEISEADKEKYDFEKNNVYIHAVSFEVKDALVVDAEAVYSESVDISNRLYVMVVEEGKLHKRFIVSNYKTEKEYLVEQGVSENQTLAILR